MFISLILLMVAGMGLSVFRFAHADDDDEYEDKYEEDDDDDSDKEDSASAENSAKPKTYQETVVVSPARIVTEQQMQTISLPDRDRDGIPDDEDIHPDIAEIYIVKDENSNGIVDTFEYGNQQ